MIHEQARVEAEQRPQRGPDEMEGLVHHQEEDTEGHDHCLAEHEPARSLLHQEPRYGVGLRPPLAQVVEGEPGIEDVEDKDRPGEGQIARAVAIDVDVLRLSLPATAQPPFPGLFVPLSVHF